MTFYAPDPFDWSEFKDPLTAQGDVWQESWINSGNKKPPVKIKPQATALPAATTTPPSAEVFQTQKTVAAAAAGENMRRKLIADSAAKEDTTGNTILGALNKGLTG